MTVPDRDPFLWTYILDVWANHRDNPFSLANQTMMLRRFISVVTVTCLEGVIGLPESEPKEHSIPKDLSAPNSGTTRSSLWISHFRTVLPEVLS
jgi:hypothetical protein